MAENFDLWLIEQSLKFDYSFTTLVFATLALSVQFSPGIGSNFPWLLVASWTCLLIAAVAGGNQIIRKQVYYRNNLIQNKAMASGKIEIVEKAETILKEEQRKGLLLYKLRQWGFLVGVFLNLLFVVANYILIANTSSCGN